MPTLNSVDVAQAAAPTKPNPRNNSAMFQIFQNVQYNVVQHKKYVKEMRKLYKKLHEDEFHESFKNALMYLFTFEDASANVDRVIQFVATFCTSFDDEEEFLTFIFEIIFECQCVSGQSVRYRASQLLAAVLAAMGEDACLDDELCDKLLHSQLKRLQDTRGAVRARAALALQRLQAPADPEDEVTRAYRFHMSCDPSASVRRAVLMVLARCARNVPFVLERLCDADDNVRRAAFLYVAAVNVTQLRLRQRLHVLKTGLGERSPRVRRVVEELVVAGWLAAHGGDVPALLRALRLDTAADRHDSRRCVDLLLDCLARRLPLSDLLESLPIDKNSRMPPLDKLTPEVARYWRHLTARLHAADDDAVEMVLPDLVVFLDLLRTVADEVSSGTETEAAERRLVLAELVAMLPVWDAPDPLSRDRLQQLLLDLLTGPEDYGADVVRGLVRALSLVWGDAALLMRHVCALASSLRDPPESAAPSEAPVPPTAPSAQNEQHAKLQRARLRVSLNVALEARDEAVRAQDYEAAARAKLHVEDLQRQLERLVEVAPPPQPPPAPPALVPRAGWEGPRLQRALQLLNVAMDTPQLTRLTNEMRLLFQELEEEIVGCVHEEAAEEALRTLALLGSLDADIAQQHKAVLFANLLSLSGAGSVGVALKAVVDLLCVHGARVFDDDRDNTTTHRETDRDTDPDPDRDTSTVTDRNRDRDTSTATIDKSVAAAADHSAVIELLLKIMDGESTEFREVAATGLCRLLTLGRLHSPHALARLLLLWFNPATAEEDGVRQTVGVFFQSFPAIDGAHDQLQAATWIVTRALARAPSSSPLSEVDQEAVLRFVASLARTAAEAGAQCPGALGCTLAARAARWARQPEAALLCRLLALLPAPSDVALAAACADTLRPLLQELGDKQSCRNLTRYLGALEAVVARHHESSEVTAATDATATTDTAATTETTAATDATVTQDSELPNPRATDSIVSAQPLARSTHVRGDDTTRHDDTTQRDDTTHHNVSTRRGGGCGAAEADGASDSDSSGASPVKRHRRVDNEADNNRVSRTKRPAATRDSNDAERGAEEADEQSADETALHTIVYDEPQVTSILELSSRGLLVVPESPETSESEPESPSPPPTKTKPRRGKNKN